MFILTHIGGFRYCDLQHTINKEESPSFFDAKWMNAGLFVKPNQLDRYKCMIGCPMRIIIG